MRAVFYSRRNGTTDEVRRKARHCGVNRRRLCLGLHPLAVAVGVHGGHLVVPPGVATVYHGTLPGEAAEDDDGLNLEVLVDVFPYGTTVQKATSNDDGLIAFSLEVALDPSSQSTPERLRELGANGLARRYELLQEKGIAL